MATQFSETRQRESALMEEARRKARSTSSTIFTATDTESNKGCYNQLLSMMKHYIQHGCRKLKTKMFGENKKQQRRHRKKKRRSTALLQGGGINGGGGRGTRYQYGNGGGDVHYHHHHHHHIHHHHLHLCNNNTTSPATTTTNQSNNQNNQLQQPKLLEQTGGRNQHQQQQRQPNGDFNMRDDEQRFVYGHCFTIHLTSKHHFQTFNRHLLSSLDSISSTFIWHALCSEKLF